MLEYETSEQLVTLVSCFKYRSFSNKVFLKMKSLKKKNIYIYT